MEKNHISLVLLVSVTHDYLFREHQEIGLHKIQLHLTPVDDQYVPHKAVAEVSKIGNL